MPCLRGVHSAKTVAVPPACQGHLQAREDLNPEVPSSSTKQILNNTFLFLGIQKFCMVIYLKMMEGCIPWIMLPKSAPSKMAFLNFVCSYTVIYLQIMEGYVPSIMRSQSAPSTFLRVRPTCLISEDRYTTYLHHQDNNCPLMIKKIMCIYVENLMFINFQLAYIYIFTYLLLIV